MKKLTEEEALQMYNDMIDECCLEWKTPRSSASDNMEEQDTIMYNCGFSDYIDSISDEYEVEGF